MYLLTKDEITLFKKLSTPIKIQEYLDALPFNYEKNGETCMSPRRVIKEKKAHCIEGAMLACAILLHYKEKPLILNLKVKNTDFDHVVALYKRNGYWGAISKTAHAVLRFRDPVYKTVRELAMSYFHEYFLVSNGKKTMVGFSKPINLNHLSKNWVIRENDMWDVAEVIFDAPVTLVVPKENEKYLKSVTVLEQKAASLLS